MAQVSAKIALRVGEAMNDLCIIDNWSTRLSSSATFEGLSVRSFISPANGCSLRLVTRRLDGLFRDQGLSRTLTDDYGFRREKPIPRKSATTDLKARTTDLKIAESRSGAAGPTTPFAFPCRK